MTEDHFIRSCICGASEEMTVQKPIEEAVVNNTNSENNGANAELVVDNAVDLFNSVLTEEERSAVAEAVFEEEDNDLDEDTEIGMYLDINLFKEVTTTDTGTSQTETIASQVTETSNKIKSTIEIPDDLINTADSVDRVYRIIRVHEDENGNLITDVIGGIFDPQTKTFTFETDKFST